MTAKENNPAPRHFEIVNYVYLFFRELYVKIDAAVLATKLGPKHKDESKGSSSL